MFSSTWLLIKIMIIGIVLIFSYSELTAVDPKIESIELVKSIADKIIEDTSFEFKLVPEESYHLVQILDFRHHFGGNRPGIGYALSYIMSKKDTTVTFGLSSSDGVKIWINDRVVFQYAESRTAEIREVDYELYHLQDTLRASLHEGANKILVKLASNRDQWICFLRAITAEGYKTRAVRFSLKPFAPDIKSSDWIYLGSFQSSTPDIKQMLTHVFPPEEEFKKFYKYKDKYYMWSTPRENVILDLAIKPTSAYTRDSYLDWHYANGTLMYGIYTLADFTGDQKYFDFVRYYCDFIIDHLDYFREQFETRYVFNGAFHQIFRMTLLDDAGAAALPHLEMYIREKSTEYLQLVESMADYIMRQQIRLNDGTFCRLIPVSSTVWADDLFMSVPFLLRMGKIKEKNSYNDEVTSQIMNFHKLLFDSEKCLFNHAWFNSTKQNSTVFWGRANGWVVWATSEVLSHIPENHPKYQTILSIFQKHVEGLAKVQDPSGLWHQVLDHPESYEETSCTAMFTLAMARGVRNGWIENKYKKIALRAWDALCEKKIESGGIVHDICAGTGISNDLEYYFNRERFDNDPRGVGAVIVAGIEISKLRDEPQSIE